MNRRNVLYGLVRTTTGLGVGMGSMLADTATAQPQTLRMGGADVPVMPNPEGGLFGTIPGATFGAYDDREKRHEAYQAWLALIPKILDGFDKEWIFDFPSVVREFELWSIFPSLSRYNPRGFPLATALLPGTITPAGKSHREATIRLAHGFDRPELASFSPPGVGVPQPDWCVDVGQIFHQITVLTGVHPTIGTRSMPSLSDGRSEVPFSWTVSRKPGEASGQLKELVVIRREGGCSIQLIAQIIARSASQWNTPGASK
jgi:hypothetical protein